jgi:hypothetical protein
LEVRDVVTPQHRGPSVQEAVTQAKTGLHQGVPRLLPAHPVDAEATQALEGLDGGAGGGTEDAVRVDGYAGEDRREAVLDVRDGLPAVAGREGEGEDQR